MQRRKAMIQPKKEESSKDTVASDNSEQSSSGAGKILVAYYSATGTTKGVAEKIAEEINGELFELKPVEEYTDDDLDWTDDDSRVSREHEDESLRDVELTEVTRKTSVMCQLSFWVIPFGGRRRSGR